MSMPMPPAPAGRPLGNMQQPAPPGAMGMMDAEMQGPTAGPDMNQLKQQFLTQIRQLVSQVDALTQTFPAFAEFGDQIMQVAQEGMIQVVAALGAQEPSQNPMGML